MRLNKLCLTLAALCLLAAPALAQEVIMPSNDVSVEGEDVTVISTEDKTKEIISSIQTIKQVPPETRDHPIVRLRALDKVTARSQTFEARVGKVLQFGSIFIKARACRKTAPIEKPEAASFLQIWDYNTADKPQWAFSGWMFASSPALSAMEHPIYDVWVLDCLDERSKGADSGEVKSDKATPDDMPDGEPANAE